MLLILFCCATAVLAQRPLQGIRTLNETFIKEILGEQQIENIVIFDFGHHESLMDQLSQELLQRPHLMITAHIEWELKDYFKKNVISLVYVETSRNEGMLEDLKKSLNRWHLECIVFITPEIGGSLDKWLPLFHWCHINGFFNTLLMDFQGFTYDFNHYVGQEIIESSAKSFLESRRKSNNLHDFAILASIGNSPPRSFYWYDKHNVAHLAGYYPKAIELFSKLYNASTKFSLMPSLSNPKAEECFPLLESGAADLCADSASMSPRYIVTYPEEISYGYLMVPRNKPLEYYYYFIKPFHPHVWLVVQVSAIYKILTLSFIHRMQRESWNVGYQIQYAVLSVLHLPFRLHRVRGWYQRFLELIMILVGFAVANWYLAVLYSILSSPLHKDHINSVDDLVKYNTPVMVNQMEENMLNNSVMPFQMGPQLLMVDKETLIEHLRSLNSSFAYYNQQDKNQFYLHQQKYKIHSRMKELTQYPINPIYPGISIRPYWPLEEKFRMFLMSLKDNGLYQHLISGAYADGITSHHLQYLPTNVHAVQPLGVEYFEMPAMLLTGGLLAAGISFGFEILIY